MDLSCEIFGFLGKKHDVVISYIGSIRESRLLVESYMLNRNTKIYLLSSGLYSTTNQRHSIQRNPTARKETCAQLKNDRGQEVRAPRKTMQDPYSQLLYANSTVRSKWNAYRSLNIFSKQRYKIERAVIAHEPETCSTATSGAVVHITSIELQLPNNRQHRTIFISKHIWRYEFRSRDNLWSTERSP